MSTLERLTEITDRFVCDRGLPDEWRGSSASTAISQDALIYGIDVDDYVVELASAFGDVVWKVPWGRFTDQRASFRGWGCLLFPAWLLWRLVTWPIRLTAIIPRPAPGRVPLQLELGHIAAVIDRGEWFEP